jgi:hypothetical protein
MAKWEIGGGAGAEGICKKEPRARGKGRGRASVSRGRQFRDFRLMWIYLASRGGEWRVNGVGGRVLKTDKIGSVLKIN